MSVANVLLQITGDSKQAQRELDQVSRDLALFGRQTADAKAELDTDSARHSLDALTARLDKFSAKDVSAAVNVRIAKATTEIARIREKLAELDRQDVTIDVELRRDLTDRIGALASSITHLGNESSTTHSKTVGLNQGFSLLGKSIGLIKWPALITGAGFAARALSVLLGGATELISTIGTGLVGALTVAAHAYLAFGQAFLAIKLADFKGVSDALKGVTGAYKALTPAAQDFVDKLRTFQGPWDEMKKRVQENLFDGLSKGLDSARGNFHFLSDAMAQTAKVLGDLGQRVGELLGSKEFGSLFQKVTSENADILKRLGNAAIDLVPAFFKILDAAKPLVDWVTKGVEAWAKQSAAWVDAAHKSGDLTTFFLRAKDALQSLVEIGGSMVKALFNIGKAAEGPGQSLLNMISGAAKAFADWTGSAKGQNTLRKYFEDLQPTLRQVGLLIRDVVKDFFSLGKGTDLAGLIKQLRTELLPVLVDLVKGTTAAFGPKLIDLLVEFGKLLGKLAGSSGPLSLYVQALTQLGKVLNFIFDTIPGVQSGTVDLLAAFALYKTLAGPIGLLKEFATAIGLIGVSSVTTTGELKGLDLVMGETGIMAGKSGTQAGSAFGKGFGVAAIAAIIVGLALLIHELDVKFGKGIKDVLNNAHDALIDFVRKLGPIGSALTLPFKLAINTVQVFWDMIRDFSAFVSDLVHGRWSDAWKDAGRFVTDFAHNVLSGLKDIIDPVRQLMGLIVDLVVGAWRGIRDVTGEVWGGIKDAILTPLRAAKDVVNEVTDTIKGAALDAFRAIRDTGSDIWHAIRDAITDPIKAARGILHDVWDGIRGAAGDAFRGIKDTAKNVFGDIVDFIGGIGGKLADKATGAAKDLGRGFIDGIEWMVGRVKDLFSSVGQIAADIGRSIANWVNDNTLFGDHIHIGLPGPVPDIDFTLPALAEGVRDFMGGLALVGERGPELVNLPRGSDVYEAGVTQKMLAALSGAGGSSTSQQVTVTPLASGNYPDAESFAAQLTMALRRRGGFR